VELLSRDACTDSFETHNSADLVLRSNVFQNAETKLFCAATAGDAEDEPSTTSLCLIGIFCVSTILRWASGGHPNYKESVDSTFMGRYFFEFEFLLIESIPTNLLLRGHNIRLRRGSKAGPDVRAFRERTGHRSLCLQSRSLVLLCVPVPLTCLTGT
jgi:hypothetical protein